MGRNRKIVSMADFDACRQCGNRVECIDSRPNDTYRRRRHRCPACSDTFTTREVYIEDWKALVDSVAKAEAVRKAIREAIIE